MKIAVCVKIVDGEVNPFDECALEEALKIQDAEVYAVSMGPLSTKDKLHSLTRLGVKKAFLLSDNAYAGSDTLATSYILSTFLRKGDFDLILCGRQTIDGDTAQVGPCLATMLGYSLCTNVMNLQSISDKVSVQTRMGNECVPLPALLTIERINTLRFPSIFSKMGEIEVIDNSVLQADTSRCGLYGSPTRVLKTFQNDSGFRKCKFIEPSEFKELVNTLSQKPRDAQQAVQSHTKLKNVWAIGETVSKKAYEIAENVRVLTQTDPQEISELAQKEKPSVILWNADLWGRKNAPIVAALLNTGLCADCTSLETDGENLFMYRPAKSGNIIAKIECTTHPQMATVRCEVKSDDIIVSGGRGVAHCTDKLKAFSEKLGAELCASRALVDKGGAEYSAQVGLTGKTVSPKIYIAVGISGAVQHTCAVGGSDVVIAINPDKDAQIFDFCDYGVVSSFEDFLNAVNL